MSGIDIALIIIGAVLIIVSYIISEKTASYRDSIKDREIWSNKDEITIKDRISIILADKSEQVVDDTEEKLCHLSNEKILEFQEFSNQLFEKLDENHNQSVFLYKMLNEKQTEMKEWISELDTRYADIKNEFGKAEEQLIKLIKKLPKNPPQTVPANKGASLKNVNRTSVGVQQAYSEQIESRATDNNKKNISQADALKNKKAVVNNKVPVQEKSEDDKKKAKNDRILKLFDSGKSIIEISKQLGMGQGEVKLVVDLYRGKKK